MDPHQEQIINTRPYFLFELLSFSVATSNCLYVFLFVCLFVCLFVFFDRFLLRTKLKLFRLNSIIGLSVQDFQMWRIPIFIFQIEVPCTAVTIGNIPVLIWFYCHSIVLSRKMKNRLVVKATYLSQGTKLTIHLSVVFIFLSHAVSKLLLVIHEISSSACYKASRLLKRNFLHAFS